MSEGDIEGLHDRFRAARERYETARSEIDELGEDNVEELTGHLRRLDHLLQDYEDRATGSGDFQGYISFRNEITAFVEGLPDDLLHREAIEAVDDIVDKRRLSTADFEEARDAVEDPRDVVARLEELENAREDFRNRRREVLDRIDTLEDRLAELDRIRRLGEADLDAPVEEIREPIERYNAAVGEAFRDYLRDTPASDVLSLLALTERYPLVPIREPPEELRAFVDSALDEATVTELLTYAEYSHSKLAHFVTDPGAFKAAVATERTYLERLDATPFEIPWPPPPPAAELRWRTRELIPLVDRFAPGEVVRSLRVVRELTRDEAWFDTLRESAAARAELTEIQRQQLIDGTVDEDRAAVREARERLVAAIEAAPDP